MAESPNQSENNQQAEVPQPVLPGGDAPQILVPVSAGDHTRARDRVRLRNILLAVAAILAIAWTYKHFTDPIHAQEALDAGDRQLRSGQYQQAIVAYDQAIGYSPEFAEAFQQRGRAKMALSRPVQALPDFVRYAELRSQDPVAYLNIGRTQLALENFSGALETAMQAVRTGPQVGAAYQLRGMALRRAGKLDEALADFNKAVDLAPEMANYYERGATYQELNQHERAIEDFTAVIGFDGLNAQAYHARSKSYRALGNDAQAEADHRYGRRMDGR